MCAPTQCADNSAEMLHRREGCIERRASHGVDDEVEAHTLRAGFNILFDRLCAVVNRSGSQTGDYFLIALTGSRPYRPAERARQLHRDVSDPARATLVGLDVEHVRFTATSVELGRHVPAADGDEHRVSVPRGATLASCPVQALQDWLRRSDTRFGPVFRKINRGGTIEQHRLGTDALRRILARRAPRRLRRTRKASA